MANELVVIDNRPEIPENWDCDQSIEKVKGTIYNWKNLTVELANELWIAREKLSSQGLRDKTPEVRTWSNYCEDIGSSRRVVNGWLARYFEPQERPKLPLPTFNESSNGTYRTLVIDPPWSMKKIVRSERPKQTQDYWLDYPTMTIDEIKQMPVGNLANQDGCHIYLWTTHRFLPDAFDILNMWGAKYECLLTWIKNVGMTPFSWMYSTEFCLFSRMGNLPLLEKGKRLDFYAKVREHSRKPDEFYDLIKTVSPEPRKDIFSREKREGFDSYGNEVDKFNEF